MAAAWKSSLGKGGCSKKPGERDPLGPWGERVAAEYMRAKGCRVLACNVVVDVGEADIVCEASDGKTIVFVEVKARRQRADGSVVHLPEASITARKKRKLLLVAQAIARKKGWERRPLRIDVVAVERPLRGEPVVRHYENAVTL